MSDAVRRLIMDDLTRVQRAMITEQEWSVLRFIKSRKTVRSNEISSRFKLSPQHTAMVTARLFAKGYLQRARQTFPSGGHEYEFQLPAALQDG